MARVSVSLTKLPPQGPKRPAASGCRAEVIGISCKLCVGRAHGGDEALDFPGVLDALERLAIGAIGLDAGADINRQRLATRADLQNAIGPVCRCESTRQNEVTVDAWWKEGPIEYLAATAITVDMGVEQDGLGLRVIQRVLYEIEPPATARAARSIAQRNPRRPQIGPGALAGRRQAILRRFIAMELYGCARDRRAGRQHIGRRRVDEQQHRGHERG